MYVKTKPVLDDKMFIFLSEFHCNGNFTVHLHPFLQSRVTFWRNGTPCTCIMEDRYRRFGETCCF